METGFSVLVNFQFRPYRFKKKISHIVPPPLTGVEGLVDSADQAVWKKLGVVEGGALLPKSMDFSEFCDPVFTDLRFYLSRFHPPPKFRRRKFMSRRLRRQLEKAFEHHVDKDLSCRQNYFIRAYVWTGKLAVLTCVKVPRVML